MQHARQHDMETYFEIINEMIITQTIRNGRTTCHIGTLEGEAVTGIYHESEGVGFIIH
jgi:hypothetical protein